MQGGDRMLDTFNNICVRKLPKWFHVENISEWKIQKDTQTAKMVPRGEYGRMEKNKKETDIPAHVEPTLGPAERVVFCHGKKCSLSINFQRDESSAC